MPMTNLINICAQCGQTGRNADKIPHHTSKVNYVRMVLHCAVWRHQTALVTSLSTLHRNNHLEVEEGPLKEFIDQAGDLSPCQECYHLTLTSYLIISMCRQRGTLLETSPALVAAHAEAGQEGESQQVEESGHHLVCLVRVGDQVSSHNVDGGHSASKSSIRIASEGS